ncbi:MAG: hypothetical protein JXB88_22450 [Spirochaetales bacterium]|nr:hypothetical protein [Spirochaetales bacterium]
MTNIIAYIKRNILAFPGTVFNYFFIPVVFIYGFILEPVLLKQTVFYFGRQNIVFFLIFNFIFIIEAFLITLKLLDARYLVSEKKDGESKKTFKDSYFLVILWVGHLGLHGLYFMFYNFNSFPRFVFIVIFSFILLKELYLLSLYLYLITKPVTRKRKISFKRRFFINMALGIISLVIITMTTATYSNIFLKNTLNKINLAGLLVLAFLMGLIFYLPARFGFFVEEFFTVRKKSGLLHLWISIIIAIFSNGLACFF